jgi:ABC-type polysaccharide/polyol phosphate transport system ATPase subunit
MPSLIDSSSLMDNPLQSLLRAASPQKLELSLPGDFAIRIQNVGVRYRAPDERIRTIKEYAIRWIQRRIKHREFWALNDVSLSIEPGESFGIIGNNGAGKSTLLRLIARVFRPTTGRVIVRGTVAPLLELGAGFNSELTGRENIFLNGALLAFSRKQMQEKIERIVEFAELGDFIDAPLRTYSSGMLARLGFSLATEVNPDILIIDEVLAVGDEAFQRKCIIRLEEFRQRSSTIVLVSHDMVAIETICHRAAWLHHGCLMVLGESREVVHAYRQSQAA